MNNIEILLKHLNKIAANNMPKNMITAVVEFLHTDAVLEVTDVILEKLICNYNFHDYFESEESIADLISIKETEPVKYYTIMQYENILINIVCIVLNMPYVIILNPEDINKSSFVVLKIKN